MVSREARRGAPSVVASAVPRIISRGSARARPMCSVRHSAVSPDRLDWTDGVARAGCDPAARWCHGDPAGTRGASFVTGFLIVLGMVVAVGGFTLAATWLRRGEHADLGSVSHQWI